MPSASAGPAAWPDARPIDVYDGVRSRLDEILRPRPDDVAGVRVPSCPEWTVREVVAHLAGGCRASVGGDTRGAPGRSWTARQVRNRAGSGLLDMLDEWAVDTARLRELLGERGGSDQMTMDALTHEYDIRGALGLPWVAPDRDVSVALGFLVPHFCYSVVYRGLPSLGVQAGPWAWAPQGGQPAGWLRGHPVEVMRALTGRRSPDQIAAMRWTADPRQWLTAFWWGPFTPPRQAVEPAADAAGGTTRPGAG